MNQIVLSVLVLCVGVFQVQPPMTLEALGLPARIKVFAVHVPESGDPFDRHRIEESLDIVNGVQETYQGEIGWLLYDTTFASDEQTIVYSPPSWRGVRDTRFSKYGTTRLDGLVTPYAWVRYARRAVASGGAIKEGRDDGRLTYTFGNPENDGVGSITCYVDRQTGELREVHKTRGQTLIYRYSDWRPIGDEKRLPFRCELEGPPTGGGNKLHLVYRIDEATIPTGPSPSPPRLPSEAIITDNITGKIVTGDGKEATPNPASQHAGRGGKAAWLTRDRIFVGAGILMLLAAGALLRYKVKRA